MFISIDQQGKVVINSITKILFVLKASKHIVVDPTKYNGPLFSSISCRFRSIHGQGLYDDMAIVAIGSTESTIIMEVRPNSHTEFFTIKRPDKFFNN